MNSATILAVDLGTTAIKCALYDERGASVAEATEEYALSTPQRNWVELDCETYWSAFKRAVERLDGPDRRLRSVAALGLSVQGETLVAVDRNGRPLRPAIVWLDNRAEAEAAELASAFDRERLYDVTGQPEMLAAWPAAKILWLARHEPQVAQQSPTYLLLEDYFLLRLTGERVTEGSLATSTCYWNFRTKRWWPEMLDAIGIDEQQLPSLVEPGEVVGPLLPGVAAELGLPTDVTVCAGALDQACGAIGAGNFGAGGFSENTGAAVALCATTGGPQMDPAGAMPCHYHALPDTYMLHTFTSGGIVLKWFRDQFYGELGDGSHVYDRLDRLAADVAPGADGLLMLPHLQGAMAPENNDLARGVLVGLTLGHGRPHILRAIMESIAFIVRRNVEALTELGVPIASVRAIGGGSRSPLWKQIEADVLGLPVVTMRQPDAGALGAAILAGVGVGWWSGIEEAVAATVVEAATYEPDARNRGVYDELFGVYVGAYEALLPSFDALARV
ncbi:MAG TPA: FGGY family carbohydrate kinase [Conexibacter sp.]|nr:FGGY family carbohydrate kinase [Conexibacter sp.]